MLKCKDIAHRTSHFIDPDLPWYKKTSWFLHLALCNNCRRFVRQFRLTVALASRLTLPKANDVEVKAVMTEIERTAPKPEP